MKTTIYIDSRELGAAYIDYLEEIEKVEVIYRQLAAGDILVNGLAIERKTVEDFLLTLQEGRLFTQLRTLKQTYCRQLLLIEGHGMRYHLDKDPFFGLYIRLAAGWQIPIFHTQGAEQTASCILRICHQDSVAPAGPMRARHRNPAWEISSVSLRVLMEIPGIGAKHASTLLEHFRTLDRVFAAEEKELRGVRGIGKTRAASLKAANNPELSKSRTHSQRVA